MRKNQYNITQEEKHCSEKWKMKRYLEERENDLKTVMLYSHGSIASVYIHY